MEDDDDEEDLEVGIDGERHANEDGVQENTELEDEDTRDLGERAVVEDAGRLKCCRHAARPQLLLEVRVVVGPLVSSFSTMFVSVTLGTAKPVRICERKSQDISKLRHYRKHENRLKKSCAP